MRRFVRSHRVRRDHRRRRGLGRGRTVAGAAAWPDGVGAAGSPGGQWPAVDRRAARRTARVAVERSARGGQALRSTPSRDCLYCGYAAARVRQSVGTEAGLRPGRERPAIRSTLRCTAAHTFWWRVHHHRHHPSRSHRCIAGALIFVLALTATASAAVGIPLACSSFESFAGNSISELGSGNWAVRLDANAEAESAISLKASTEPLRSFSSSFAGTRRVAAGGVFHGGRFPRSPACDFRSGCSRAGSSSPTRGIAFEHWATTSTSSTSSEHRARRVDGTRFDYEYPARANSSSNPCWSRWRETSPLSEKARSRPITLMVPPNVTVCANQRQFAKSHRESPAQRPALRARICRRRSAGRHRQHRHRGPRRRARYPREQWTRRP